MIVSNLQEILNLGFREGPFCTIGHLVSSISLLGTVTVVVVRTGRMARIYFASSKLKRAGGDWTMMTRAQVLFVSVLLGVFTLLEIAEILLKPPERKRIYTEEKTFEVCQEWLYGAVIMDCCTASLIAIAVVFAFFTRKVILTFSESNYLFLCSLSLFIVWSTMRTAYYLAKDVRKPLWQTMFILAHNFVLWSWLVAPRLYIIVFRPTKLHKYSFKSFANRGARKNLDISNSLPKSKPNLGSSEQEQMKYLSFSYSSN